MFAYTRISSELGDFRLKATPLLTKHAYASTFSRIGEYTEFCRDSLDGCTCNGL